MSLKFLKLSTSILALAIGLAFNAAASDDGDEARPMSPVLSAPQPLVKIDPFATLRDGFECKDDTYELKVYRKTKDISEDEFTKRGEAIGANRDLFFNRYMDEWTKVKIINDLMMHPSEEIPRIGTAIKENIDSSFPQARMVDKDLVRAAFVYLNADEIYPKVTTISKCMTFLKTQIPGFNMLGVDEAQIIIALAGLSNNEMMPQCKAIARNHGYYFTNNVYAVQRQAKIFKAIIQAKLTDEEIAQKGEIIATNGYFLNKPNGEEQFGAIETLIAVPIAKIKAIATTSGKYFTEAMNNGERLILIKHIAELKNHEEIIQKGEAFAESKAKFITDDIGFLDRLYILVDVLHLTPDEIIQKGQAIADAKANLFTADMNGEMQSEIIKRALRLPPKEIRQRSAAIAATRGLYFTDSMPPMVKATVITGLLALTAEQIDATASNIDHYFGHIKGEKSYEMQWKRGYEIVAQANDITRLFEKLANLTVEEINQRS